MYDYEAGGFDARSTNVRGIGRLIKEDLRVVELTEMLDPCHDELIRSSDRGADFQQFLQSVQ